jgi:hypothetical protein
MAVARKRRTPNSKPPKFPKFYGKGKDRVPVPPHYAAFYPAGDLDDDWTPEMEEWEPTKLDMADAFERAGHLEAAAELRAEWEAEEEAREAEEAEQERARAAREHELRSQRAKQAAQTRKQRQAERAATVAAAAVLLADTRQSS